MCGTWANLIGTGASGARPESVAATAKTAPIATRTAVYPETGRSTRFICPPLKKLKRGPSCHAAGPLATGGPRRRFAGLSALLSVHVVVRDDHAVGRVDANQEEHRALRMPATYPIDDETGRSRRRGFQR